MGSIISQQKAKLEKKNINMTNPRKTSYQNWKENKTHKDSRKDGHWNAQELRRLGLEAEVMHDTAMIEGFGRREQVTGDRSDPLEAVAAR